jgi:hypothetical protein
MLAWKAGVPISAGWQPDPIHAAGHVHFPAVAPLAFSATWYAEVETREEAIQRIDQAFQKKLRAYLDEVQLVTGSAGLRSQSFPRSVSETMDRDCAWYVFYQCKWMTQAEIADTFGVSIQAVSSGIHRAARILGLTVVDGRARPREFKGRVSSRWR